MYSIDVRHVSKVYKLYRKPSDRLKEVLIRRPLHQAFHSLDDISFAVPVGESLGIIGDNGAGKSTILKLVAGTVSPTAGEIMINGRVAALLELGSGFHYEFTGRQNIWMNASLMGLDKDEIAAREEAIIDFSELGDFIDRPIKTYSSGMVMRLAFSIATSVDPDILIIDEALSVGDHYFQKKSIDRMLDFKKRNKTILFCSHATFLVDQLCDRALWFDHGKIREMGKTTHVTAAYENYNRGKTEASEGSVPVVPATTAALPVVVKSVLLNGSMENITLCQGEGLRVEVEYECFADLGFFIAVGIRRNDNVICHAVNMAKEIDQPLGGKGVGKVVLQYCSLPFFHGDFSVVVSILDTSGLQCFHQKESSVFSILPPDGWEHEIGLLKLDHEWLLA